MSRLILGTRAVVEALRAPNRQVHAVFVDTAETRLDRDLAAALKQRGYAPETKPREELDALAGGGKHQGVIAVTGEYPYVELEDLLALEGGPHLWIALDQISDPHNLGAIVRSAVAFGADGIITLKDRAAPVTAVAVRASAGATEHARIARVTNLAETLRRLVDEGFEVVGLAGEATDALDTLTYGDRGLVLVVGSEGDGLRRLVRERCTRLVRIPMDGPIASLNASVAAGIALSRAAALRPKGNR